MDISSLTIQMKAARRSVAFDVDYFYTKLSFFFRLLDSIFQYQLADEIQNM